jgi:predicted GNAT family acetyltransferase
MKLEHQQTENEGKIYFVEEKHDIAKMTYSIESGKLVVDHTKVSADHRGEGLGVKLLEALVAYAREKEFKILPLCPFVASTFEKRSDLQDVLKQTD